MAAPGHDWTFTAPRRAWLSLLLCHPVAVPPLSSNKQAKRLLPREGCLVHAKNSARAGGSFFHTQVLATN